MNEAMVRGERPASPADGSRDEAHPHDLLDVEGILALLAYEETHGKRAAVVQALTERLRAVRSGAEPTGPLGEYLPLAG